MPKWQRLGNDFSKHAVEALKTFVDAAVYADFVDNLFISIHCLLHMAVTIRFE